MVANLGNLVNRTMKFLNSFYGGIIPKGGVGKRERTFFKEVKEKSKEVITLLDEVKIKDSLRGIMNISKLGNQYFQESEPWKTFKLDKKKADTSLFTLINFVKDLSILIKPFMPRISELIEKQLNIKSKDFGDLGKLSIVSGHKVGSARALFERLNNDEIEKFREKFGGKKEREDRFGKVDLRVAEILEVEDHPDADKLYVLKINTGKGKRQICAGIKNDYSKKDLVGRKIIVVVNLKAATLRGLESQGMLLAAETDGVCRLLEVDKSKVGDRVYVDKESKPAKQITIEEFLKFKIKVKKGEIEYKEKKLKTDKEEVTVRDMRDGSRVH